MNNEGTATEISRTPQRWPDRPCSWAGCRLGPDGGRKIFPPKVEHQEYCCESHRVLASRKRKFDAAVEAEVARRIQAMGTAKNAH